MRSYNIHEAKTHLSRLIDRAAKGESFVIAKAGKPLVKVVAIDAPTTQKKRRGFLAGHKGGLVVVLHDVSLLETVVNTVWYLDANRSCVDVYNVGWRAYLDQRETDERRRHGQKNCRRAD